MSTKNFMRADEVAAELDVSEAYAYKIIRQLNEELKAKGYITVSGRVNRNYFMKKTLLWHSRRKEGLIYGCIQRY